MWVVILLTTILVVLIHWILTSPYSYWKKRGVPSPPPTILLGNLGPSVTLSKNLGQIYEEFYNDQKYKDYLYIGYYKFRKPGILLRDIELIKQVLVKDFSSFHSNDIHVDDKIDPLFARNPFVLTGQKWKQIRNLVTSGITSSKIRSMLYLITHVSDKMIKYIDENGVSYETKELSAKFTTDVVASCAFGIEAKCFESETSQFREMGKKFIAPTFLNGLKHMLLFILPSLYRFLQIKFLSQEVEDWFTTIVQEAVKYRAQNNIVRHDYLDILIELREKADDLSFTDKDVIAQALTFYGDGFETSSITLSHALYDLAENQDIQTKLREEIDQILAKHNNEITYDAIQEMHYLDKVFNESTRLHAAVLFMARLCTKRFELPPPRGEGTGPNVVIEPGTPMVIPVLAIHNDPKYYPDPSKFDPERFSEENKKLRPKCTYLPFGDGPRICLGSKFGITQTKVGIISIIKNYEVRVNPKTERPLKMDPKFFMTSPIGGLWLDFIKRKK